MLFNKEIRRKYLGFDDFWLIIVGIPVLGFIIPILFFNSLTEKGVSGIPESTLEGSLFALGYWLSNRWGIIKVRQYYTDFESSKRRLLLQVVVSTIMITIVTPFLVIFTNFVGYVCHLDFHDHSSVIQSMGGTFFITFFMLSIYESIYFYHHLKRSILEKEAVKQAHIRSQWEGLRNQVNPHFLFNSLNTLMNIVAEDQELAQRFLKKLSTVYRYILESREDPLINLDEELKFIHSYIFLQQERFKGKLQVNMNIPEHFENYKIVPLSLQILFENVIKHNIISKKRPLTIEVFVNDDHKLIVRNNLQRKPQVMDSTKVGLANIRTRYAFFSEETVDVEETHDYFSVSIPLLSPSNVVI